MKHIFKKNQIIITALAIMIAVAGYLNYSGKILDEELNTVSTNEDVLLYTEDSLSENSAENLNESSLDYETTYADIYTLDADGTDSDTAAAAVGEAVLASTSAGNQILAQARLSREQVRAKSREELLEVINNASITQEQKQTAADLLTQLTQNAELEADAELLLEAKGFTDCVVSITDDTADVVVSNTELSEAQRAQIEDIVKRKTGIAGENIVITPQGSSQEEESNS